MSEDTTKYRTLHRCNITTRVVTASKHVVWLTCLKEMNHEAEHAFLSGCPTCGHDLLDPRSQAAPVAMAAKPSAKRCAKFATSYYVGTLVSGGPWARTAQRVHCGLVEGHEGDHQP